MSVDALAVILAKSSYLHFRFILVNSVGLRVYMMNCIIILEVGLSGCNLIQLAAFVVDGRI